ncbi:TetR/AcrR family transcriptional regulator [Gordonia hankookensis]|uniref:TetR/AcrR family transcriptional regulator n=1 Tax=Gordonia hankookensis TaxID=589403 RepID=A0ABR7WG64_9ACTN|nr:TetR/AcrR family transcriptional regulator [Gordonia hankookensis]MBD1321757.1 TetR/AcrR family transcriptional regulator [Gordonia hankookensis]
MGRTQAYDTATVVASARNLFWKRGFDGVSVSDMEKATGLSRSSIYHAFGSMRGLFDAAVQDYLDTIVRPRIRALREPDVAPGALAGYLAGLTEAIGRLGDADQPTGCLLVGAAGTTLADDEAVRQVVGAYHAELLAAVSRGVAARFPDDDAESVAARATSITGATIAAMTLARVNRAEAVRLLDVTSAMVR